MACCCFRFIHPATAITTNRNGSKMFGYFPQLIIPYSSIRLINALSFQPIEYLENTGSEIQEARRIHTLVYVCRHREG
jgi:hypothetical protein